MSEDSERIAIKISARVMVFAIIPIILYWCSRDCGAWFKLFAICSQSIGMALFVWGSSRSVLNQ